MGRLDEDTEEIAVEKSKTKEPAKIKGLGNKIQRLGKKADKKAETILIQYLNMKQQVVFKVCKIVSGNIVVIDNKVHELNPKDIWIYKKTLWYILREIDRKPISNRDYNQVKMRGDDTDSDVPLIKAVLGAVQKPQAMEAKNLWIIILIIAIVAIGAFFLLYKG